MSGSFNGPPVGRRPRWPFSALQRTPGSNIATVVRPSGRQAFDRRDLIPPPRGPAQHTNGFAELHQPRSFHELPVDPQKLQDFDCPIRAGPNDGELRCTWRSTRDGGYGFSLLSRMREHVGGHGLVCLDCRQIFTVPTDFKNHRKLKNENGVCSSLNAKKKSFPCAISLPAEIIEEFFKSPSQTSNDRSEHDAWMDGYKILHPNWENQGILPSSSYKENKEREMAASSIAPDAIRGDVSFAVGPLAAIHPRPQFSATSSTSNSTVSQQLPDKQKQLATGIGMSSSDSEIRLDLDPSLLDDQQFSQMNDFSWWDYIDETQAGPSRSTFSESHGIVAPLVEIQMDGQRVSTNTEAHESPTRASATHVLSPSGVSRNPYRRGLSDDSRIIGSSMHSGESRSGSSSRQERSLAGSTFSPPPTSLSSTTTHSAQSMQKRRLAAKKIEKLHTEVRGLYSEIQKLYTENQSLRNKHIESERAKQSALAILGRIESEIDIFELTDDETTEHYERLVAVFQTMANIRALLQQKDGEDDTIMLLEQHVGSNSNYPQQRADFQMPAG